MDANTRAMIEALVEAMKDVIIDELAPLKTRLAALEDGQKVKSLTTNQKPRLRRAGVVGDDL